jgi:hypothetical protein
LIEQLSIFDLSGKQIVQYKAFNNSRPLDLKMLKTGMYVIKLETKNAVFTEKLLIN